jgi:hypothetical protein
VKIRGGKDEEM